MSCTLTESERSYELHIPTGYWVLDSMPDFSYQDWITAIRFAGQHRQMSPALANKIMNSLIRMPDLADGQKCLVSYSGKDSQCVALLAVMKYGKENVELVFADTDDEWAETYEFQPVFAEWLGVKLHILKSTGLHELIRTKRYNPTFPKPNSRWCTKDMKMNTQRDFMDEQGYDQVRKDRKPAQMRDFYDNRLVDVKYPAPLTMSGERRSESEARKDTKLDERTGELLRWTHRPVVDWTINDVWDFIFWMQSPYNPVYLIVMRVACAGCMYTGKEEWKLLGKHHPEHLKRWAETEEIAGIDFSPSKKFSIRHLYAEMEASGELGMYNKTNKRAQITDSVREQLYKKIDHWYHYWSESWTDDRIAERVKGEFTSHSRKYEEDEEYRDFLDSIDFLQVCLDYREDHEIPDPSDTAVMKTWNDGYRAEYKRKQLAKLRTVSADDLWKMVFNGGFINHDGDGAVVNCLNQGDDKAAAKCFKDQAGLGGSTSVGDHWGGSNYGSKGWELKLEDGRLLKMTHEQMVQFYKKNFYGYRKNDWAKKEADWNRYPIGSIITSTAPWHDGKKKWEIISYPAHSPKHVLGRAMGRDLDMLDRSYVLLLKEGTGQEAGTEDWNIEQDGQKQTEEAKEYAEV